ncbi:ABC transporter ATP-binding protein [Bradyrhizobium liaoningense]
MAEAALEIEDLHSYYGDSHVLHGMDFSVRRGEVVALVGRNGAGRTTTLRAIMGLMDRCEGAVRIDGKDVGALPPHRIARLGVGYCPEERGIFATLSTRENLMLPPAIGSNGLSLDVIYEMFPNLAERAESPGSRLSGGEQQMLAVARILRTGANILLLDEISEGLAPVIVRQLGAIIRTLRGMGYTIVLVEQNFRFVSPLVDRLLVVEHGRIVDEFDARGAAAHVNELHRYLGV